MPFRQRIPKDTSQILWTQHSISKMRHYGISESKIRRIIRNPQRTEQGIALNTIAAMQKANTKRPQEIWMMYQRRNSKIVIISAWRYPGISPVGKPIPIPNDIRDYILKGNF